MGDYDGSEDRLARPGYAPTKQRLLLAVDVQEEFLEPLEDHMICDVRGALRGVTVTQETSAVCTTRGYRINYCLLWCPKAAKQPTRLAFPQRLREGATKIQVSFCAIREITGVYVLVADKYITPAINKMGALADATDEEWPAKKADFTDWCRESKIEI